MYFNSRYIRFHPFMRQVISDGGSMTQDWCINWFIHEQRILILYKISMYKLLSLLIPSMRTLVSHNHWQVGPWPVRVFRGLELPV